jgi:gamma-glutamylcyclotransferase (GGCT)/AIG2-like uncharacterized protein YtfP
MTNHSVIGYSYEVSPELLKVVDDWEKLGTDYTRETKTFINMWTNETISVDIYIKIKDYEVSVHSVHERVLPDLEILL